MANFTVRIELHDANWDDYNLLYKEAAKRGLVDVIKSDDGKVYKLPPAEYNCSNKADRADVLEAAKAAASATMKKFAVVVTESAGRTWVGLEAA